MESTNFSETKSERVLMLIKNLMDIKSHDLERNSVN